MFPSGKWAGFWEQAIFGRQPMTEFELRFGPDGTVTGEGRDVIGRFTFSGRCTVDGMVRMVKQYVGKHRVLYEGRHAGEGLIVGTWSIGEYWKGHFEMQAVGGRANPDAPIVDIV